MLAAVVQTATVQPAYGVLASVVQAATVQPAYGVLASVVQAGTVQVDHGVSTPVQVGSVQARDAPAGVALAEHTH